MVIKPVFRNGDDEVRNNQGWNRLIDSEFKSLSLVIMEGMVRGTFPPRLIQPFRHATASK